MGCHTTHTTDIETLRQPKKSNRKGCCTIDMNVSCEYSEYQITQQRGKRYMKKRCEQSHNQQTKSKDRKQSSYNVQKAVNQKNEIDNMKMSLNKIQHINESESFLEVVDEIPMTDR